MAKLDKSKLQRQVIKVTDAKQFGKVAVLYGGRSAEREVSLMSGQAVYDGLIEKGVDAHLVDYAEVFPDDLIAQGFDRVWIALHGRGGEDGSLQGALEQLNFPYTGSNVLGSALAMDKLRSKQVMQAAGLKTPAWATIYADQPYVIDEIVNALGLPVVVKPAQEGSSIGMAIVDNESALVHAIEQALELDDTVLVEQYIEGKEITGAVLHSEALPLIYIETPREFYDYEAKYFSETTNYHCPSGLTADLEDDLRTQCLQAFEVLGCYGWGRTDLMLDADNTAWILEVNTVPGMTSHSLVPMAAKEAGMSFADLVWNVLETSMTSAVTAEVLA